MTALKPLIIGLLSLSLYQPSIAQSSAQTQAQAEAEAEAEILNEKLSEAIELDELSTLKPLMAEYLTLDVEMPPAYLLAWAKMEKSKGSLHTAQAVLQKFLDTAPKSHPQYSEAQALSNHYVHAEMANGREMREAMRAAKAEYLARQEVEKAGE